jgi:hypothetical protein
MTQAGNSWERRAAGLASDVQRWLIRTSARNVRDELSDQVRKVFRGQESEPADVWAAATTEPPDAADQPPECAWCPICRAARRIAESRIAAENRAGAPERTAGTAGPPDASKPAEGRGGPETWAGPRLADAVDTVAGAADVVAGAIRDALAGLDSILSYRPDDGGTARSRSGAASGTATEAAEAIEPDSQVLPSVTEQPSTSRPGGDRAEEPEDEPGHRG